MSDTKTWSHDELLVDLAGHLRCRQRMVWTDMQLGPSGSVRPDVYVIEKSFVRFCPMAYEVKASVSDYRADVTAGKWQSYLRYAGGVVFACRAGLIGKDDLPAGCGLMYRGDNSWRTVRKATLHPVELDRDAWLKLLIDGVDRAAVTRLAHHTVEWRCEMGVRRKFGDEVGRLLARAVSADEIVKAAEEQARVIVDRALSQADKSARSESEQECSAREAVAALVGRDPSVGWRTLASELRRVVAECNADRRVESMRSTLNRIEQMARAYGHEVRLSAESSE